MSDTTTSDATTSGVRRRRLAVALVAGVVALTIGAAPASARTASWRSVSPTGLGDAVLNDVSSEKGATWTAGIDVTDWSPLALRRNGTGWTRTPQPVAHGRLDDIVAATGGEAWAVGSRGGGDDRDVPTVERWDGTSWKLEDLPLPEDGHGILHAVAVSPGGTVWAGGGLFGDDPDGYQSPLLMTRSPRGEWRNVEVPAAASVGSTISILPLTEDDVWLVGAKGVAHFDGSAWTRQRLPAQLDGQTFYLDGIARRKPGEIWVVGLVEDDRLWRRPLVLRLHHGRWAEVPTPKETAQLHGISFDDHNRPLIVGETRDPAVDPGFSYVLTMDRRGHLVRGKQPPGAGRLYGTDVDEQGRIWTAGVIDDSSGVYVPYVAVRG
ncbi:hypothetical protein ACIPSA_38135 [Streptomyces sp. NPDC086549]|uniref:hypothetical protein n=1 Tax=Streptomyces sp. NPDC086549 TaxID=3365752 RepID=UPI003806F4EC